MTNLTNPIEIAVAPLKSVAVEGAEKFALEYLAEIKAEMEEGGWDLNVVAPFPTNTLMYQDIKAYRVAKQKHATFVSLTTCDHSKPSRGRRSDPNWVVWSDVKAEKFVEAARFEAGFQFEKFVCKLTRKVGEVIAAEIHVDHGVWGYSTLTVTREDGSKESWTTQQIYNISKLGKVFPQWPTRKAK